jgi:hypothetical protein
MLLWAGIQAYATYLPAFTDKTGLTMADSNKELNSLIEKDHEALQHAMKELEVAFDDNPSPVDFLNWKLQRLWQLRDFNNQIQKHFDLEENDGYNEELIRIAPHLFGQIEHLEEDHLKISTDLNHIIQVLKQVDRVESAKIDRVKVRVKRLVRYIHEHEDAELRINQDAYYQDIGGGD